MDHSADIWAIDASAYKFKQVVLSHDKVIHGDFLLDYILQILDPA